MGGIYAYTHYAWQQPFAGNKGNFIINKGEGLNQISHDLYRAHHIKQPWIFILMLRLQGKAGQIQAGEYALNANLSMQDIAELLVKGKRLTHRITIPEGLRRMDVYDLIKDNLTLTGAINHEAWRDTLLLPETYHFHYPDSRHMLLMRMEQAMQAYLEQAWPLRDKNLTLVHQQEAVILASIIEAETDLPEERPLISAVFHNRLQKNMRLQSDPTVAFALNNERKLARQLTKQDLKIDNPYNTYRYHGLPPSPINFPGKAAIHAALHPAKSNALYFVATGKGGHYFADDYHTHRKNIAKYKRNLATKP